MSSEDALAASALVVANNTAARFGKSAAAASGTKCIQDPRDRETFYKDLYAYHDNKGTPVDRVPRINGREVDLHRLYNLVIGRGGWAKVNYRNEWDELLSDFHMSAKCVNAAVVLKQIYMRFLDRYEKLHFQGAGNDDNDRLDDADDDHINNRHKKWSNKSALNEVPLRYNYGQHAVPEQQRLAHKMSTDLYVATEYERLIMSLMSPLPNEQDFAINVCTLMSNESKHTLKIDACPKLLEVLLGHAGVYSHYTLRSIFLEFYAKIRRNSLQSFWTDLLRHQPHILELAYDDYVDLPADLDVDTASALDNPFEDGLNCQRASELFDFDGLDFLNLRRGLGTHDYVGQRVHQVATILRNLSYNAENSATLVRNRTFVRFLVMCANIRWGNLHHMGLDMLGNVAGELELCDPAADDLTRSLLSTVSDGLEGPDRGVIITCLEVLHKLSRHEQNEDQLHKCLTQRTYAQIGQYLSLNDIMLLLYTLECVYALSALGERACANLVQVVGLLGQLVALVTVEAQSYGPDGCILMRVVETVPTASAAMAAMATTGGSSAAGVNGVNGSMGGVGATPTPNRWHTLAPAGSGSGQAAGGVGDSDTSGIPSFATEKIHHQFLAAPTTPPLLVPRYVPLPTPPVHTTPKSTHATAVMATAQPEPTLTASTTTAAAAAPTSTTATSKSLSQQQIMQDNEQFASAWLRATFEQLATPQMGRIEQQDLYRMYLSASAKLGRADCASQLHFPRAVRAVFGATVGPNVAKLSGHDVATPVTTATLYYEGLRVRPKPLPMVHKGTILQGHVQLADGSIKAEPKETIKLEPNSAGAAPKSNVTSTAVVGSSSSYSKPTDTAGLVSTPAPVSPSVTSSSSSTSSTALIKSLLANKVTAAGSSGQSQASQFVGGPKLVASAPSTSASLLTAKVNVHQVAQRQQLQKEKELAIQQQQQQQQQQHHQNVVFSSKLLPPAGRLDSAPPPLAPLSGGTGDMPASLVLPADVCIDGATDDTDAAGKHSPVVTSNKMLADLLDRKSGGPPAFAAGDSNKLKRKMDGLGGDTTSSSSSSSPPSMVATTVPTKRSATDDAAGNVTGPKVPSSNAANLYAKLAASLLEDEDMDEEMADIEQSKKSPAPAIQQQQRHQIIVSSQPALSTKPLIIQQQQSGAFGAPMPMLLQPAGAGGQIANFQIGQSVLQPIIQAPMAPNTTQYMLATNSQTGQTYLVAQQAAPAGSTVMASGAQQMPTKSNIQTAQQQTLVMQGSGTSQTIYILQQPVQQQQQQTVVKTVAAGQPPKVIQTSIASGCLPQQVQLVQRQQPPLQTIDDTSSTSTTKQSPILLAGPAGQLILSTKPPPQLVAQQPQTATTVQPVKAIATLPQTQVTTTVPVASATQPPVSGNKSGPVSQQLPLPEKTSPPAPLAAVAVAKANAVEDKWDPNWLYVCDWRGCPRKRFRSANELYLHTCQAHCPDNIDPNAEIYCQWGDGPNLCDNVPRKRFSLMTHLFDRHLPLKPLKQAVYRRLHAPPPQANDATAPVTIIKNPVSSASTAAGGGVGNAVGASATASGDSTSTWQSGSPSAASAAMQAIKRHAMDFVNPKELMDENEGPVTKSIRLTAALILRNLVNYTGSAKRMLRFYEPHLAGVALSNVESSRTIAQVLFEMSESR